MDKLSYDHAPIRRRRRRMLVALLLASSLATIGAGAMSLAVFTDSEASTGAWTTGSIVLGVSPDAAFDVSGIMPGASGTQIIGVTNNGTSQLRYALSSVASDTDNKHLAANMDLVITTG
ncbi:MAG: TasA family protein, partial [Candidatus Limnocylindrales bacterium]